MLRSLFILVFGCQFFYYADSYHETFGAFGVSQASLGVVARLSSLDTSLGRQRAIHHRAALEQQAALAQQRVDRLEDALRQAVRFE